MASRYDSDLRVAKDWVEKIEEQFGFERHDHGIHMAIVEAFEQRYESSSSWYSSTVGQFIEEVQSLANKGYRDGQRDVFEWLIAKGVKPPCPVCLNKITAKNPLSEDALMCEKCRYE